MRRIGWWLLGAAAVAGTLSDRVETRAPLWIGGYRVLAADFHVHAFPLSASSIAPWDLALEARRQGLDALVISGHNEAMTGKWGRWFGRLTGDPIVLAGEEIHGPRFHLIALGIERAISWRLPAAEAIDEIHRQGGVAIAAHPVAAAWPAFDSAAMARLDAAEVMQPIAFRDEQDRLELEEFFHRGPLAAIGSSDYHGAGRLGLCRTHVFVREASEAGILEALRARRTVVMDRGRVYGDAELIALSKGKLQDGATGRGAMEWLSAVCGVAGLAGVAAAGFRRRA